MRIFLGYVLFIMRRFLSLPKRKFMNLFVRDAGSSKYKKVIKDKEKVIRDVLGKKMVLPVSDKGLSRDLIIHGIREPHCVEIVFQDLLITKNVKVF